MKLRFAFAGFRHAHIRSLLSHAKAHPSIEVVALSEEDETTRKVIEAEGEIALTHDSHAAMLQEVPCDVVAIGEVYGRRGELIIAALKAGKHVISDKPICTRLDELDEIGRLAREANLQIGCQLDLRNAAPMITLRKVIRERMIGEVVTVNITGQHPLNLGVRPAWYFEPGAHGGTINDIGIHAFDLLPWLTGYRVEEVLAARCWNAKAKKHPHFGDCAQMMARLGNGVGVLADFSYLAAARLGFPDPVYWNITCHGLEGVASTSYGAKQVRVVKDGDPAPREIALEPAQDGRYLDDFLLCIEGRQAEAELTTEAVLKAAREALSAQAMAE